MRVTLVVVVVAALCTPFPACASDGQSALGADAAHHDAEPPRQPEPPVSKLTAKLLDEIARVKRTGTAARESAAPDGVRLDDKGRVLVDIRAAVADPLNQHIATVGGTIVSASPRYESTIAWIPVLSLERLAEDSSVRSIVPAAEPTLQ